MAFGRFDSRSPDSTMSEINMVPLIDVMLVLLVIFIITAPLLSHSIRINVPQVTAQPVERNPRVIDLAIDAGGALFWNDQPVSRDSLAALFAQEAGTDPQTEIRIRADAGTRYGMLAEIMGAARQAGVTRLGFVTRPDGAVPPPVSLGPSPSTQAARAAPGAAVAPSAAGQASSTHP